MPKKLLTVCMLVGLGSVSTECAAAASCPSVSAEGWSSQIRQLFAECDNSVRSPNGRLKFLVPSSQRIYFEKQGKSLAFQGRKTLVLPATASWSPNSEVLAVNDGQGSGLSSTIRLFVIGESTVTENSQVNRDIELKYRAIKRCSNAQDNPNVYAAGWSSDGARLYLISQATVNNPCGDPVSYLGFIVDTKQFRIVKVLTSYAVKRRWNNILPRELK